ncbi:MAG: hypothetical protein ACM3W4_03820 [Ignavibacteriales bacterium]
MDTPFTVCEYSPEQLVRLLVDGSHGGDPAKIGGKQQVKVLHGYLERIGARTIVCEHKYVDRDFLEDYAGYYSRSFQDYRRFCQRIHFFSRRFSEDDLRSVLLGKRKPSDLGLSDIYLGFIVVRPLPEKIIGRTCLAPYPDDGRQRFFPANRPYAVSLFGLDLEVRTVAFQEQDREVAACATSALWSLFQATGRIFHHPMPSPVEITRSATRFHPEAGRSFPSQGLSTLQQASAIRSLGLEPLLIKVKDEGKPVAVNLLKSTFYAYARARVPAVLSFRLVPVRSDAAPLGYHAVTALGYSLDQTKAEPIYDGGPLLTATRINRLYVHDDQVCPFARLRFEGGTIRTEWRGGDGEMLAEPRHLIVPLYHKIRTAFLDIYRPIAEFDKMIERMRNKTGVYDRRLVWDIHLTDVTALRRAIFDDQAISPEQRFLALTRNMPRFLWRAIASVGDRRVLDLLFDATDLSQAASPCEILSCHPRLAEAASVMLCDPDHVRKIKNFKAIIIALARAETGA